MTMLCPTIPPGSTSERGRRPHSHLPFCRKAKLLRDLALLTPPSPASKKTSHRGQTVRKMFVACSLGHLPCLGLAAIWPSDKTRHWRSTEEDLSCCWEETSQLTRTLRDVFSFLFLFPVDRTPSAIARLAKREFGPRNCLSKGSRIIQDLYRQIARIILWVWNLPHKMVKNHSASESFLPREVYEWKKKVGLKDSREKEAEFAVDDILSINLHIGLEMLPFKICLICCIWNYLFVRNNPYCCYLKILSVNWGNGIHMSRSPKKETRKSLSKSLGTFTADFPVPAVSVSPNSSANSQYSIFCKLSSVVS